MTDMVRWGFIGPGRIAARVAQDLVRTDGGILHAVGSRSLDRARVFADQYQAPLAYGSYADLLADADVDAVYIATPHRQHHAIALAAVAAGKHLLVEKAFTCTLAGAREVVEAARGAGLFCMEAMWTRFQPAIVAARRLLEEGAIGEIRSVRADLGVRTPYDPADRLWDPSQGGGALLDVGVYPISFIQYVLGGAPASVAVGGSRATNDVDAEAALLWRDGTGRTGVAQSSLLSPLPGTAAVFGTDGWIEIPPRFHHPDRILLHRTQVDGRTGEAEVITAPPVGGGYSHELDEVHRCIASGSTESAIMPLDDTLIVMDVLERALHALGVVHDEDAVAL